MADEGGQREQQERMGLPLRIGIGVAVGFGALASGFLVSRRGRRLVADTFRGMRRSPLSDRVLDRLWGDPVLGRRRIEVDELPDGVILLTGSVAGERERSMAREAASEVPGVRAVQDRLVLDPTLRRRRSRATRRGSVAVLAALAAMGWGAFAPSPVQWSSERAQAQQERGDRGQDTARARGRGNAQRPEQARGQGPGQRPPQARGQPGEAGRGGPPAHAAARGRRGGPAPDREAFNRGLPERAIRARARRGDRSAVDLRREDGRVRLVRNDGAELFSLPEDVADDLGYWRLAVAPAFREVRRDDGGAAGDPARDRPRTIFGDVRYDDRDRSGSPAFCRSGAGHPVWGREWCLDKGFGLGDGGGLWGRTTNPEDVIFRIPRTERQTELDRGGLVDVLGDIVFGRLALQSLVLGADQPLTGAWIGETDGPRVLRVRAGDLPVAELVDGDRDGDVEVLLVNLGG